MKEISLHLFRRFQWFALVCLLAPTTPIFAGSGKVLRPPFAVPQQYIVILEPAQKLAPANVANELARSHRGTVKAVWSAATAGFLLTIPDVAAEAIARDPRVKIVEQDSRIFLSATQDTSIPPPATQPGAGSLWGLDRIDERTFDGLNTYSYCDDGFGTKIYVVDTGVLKTHQEFYRSGTDTTTRVENGRSFTSDESYPAPGDAADYGTNPCGVLTGQGATVNGSHGTSVASIAAGRLTGVAKTATIVPVKVINCQSVGHVSNVISALDWIEDEHLNTPSTPKVINMSLFYYLPGAPVQYCDGRAVTIPLLTSELTSLEDTIQRVVRPDVDVNGYTIPGITVVVSANNQNQDARNLSPARMGYGNTAIAGEHVITVGGSMFSGGVDSRWTASNAVYNACTNTDPGSNYGPAVDIFAPAHDITAATASESGLTTPFWGYRWIEDGRSGTSFAAPFVTGVIARYLLVNTGAQSPLDVWQYLQNYSTYDVLNPATLNGSPNRLLYRGGATTCRVRPS